jgi:hypothetical protein
MLAQIGAVEGASGGGGRDERNPGNGGRTPAPQAQPTFAIPADAIAPVSKTRQNLN